MEANPQGAANRDIVSQLSGILSESSRPTEKPQKPEEAAKKSNEALETSKKDDTESNSRRIKAKLGDKEIELEVLSDDIDLDLIPKGLMMESDYRKKTSELSESRKSLDGEKQQLQEQLQDLEDMLFGEAKELDSKEMLELKEDDPTEYLKKRDAFDRKVKKLKGYKESMSEDLKSKHESLLKAEIEKYTEVIPEWMDAKAKEADTSKMVQTLKAAGFSDEELSSIYDHRLMAVFRKAALYDEIKNTPIEKSRPKVTKSVKPESNDHSDTMTDYQKGMVSLKKTGKQKDAIAAIKSIL